LDLLLERGEERVDVEEEDRPVGMDAELGPGRHFHHLEEEMRGD
jgi:hypothetical protein